MQHLYGPPAFTPFLCDKLIATAALSELESAEVFFLDLAAPLELADEERISSLLSVGTSPQNRDPDLIIIPRVGTISPWSSKATEILAVCGIDAVNRVERGIALWVSGDISALLPHVCDPMTSQRIATLGEAAALFQVSSPAPVGRIALGSTPIAALDKANKRLGLALSDDEISYLADGYADLDRDPTDVELLMFSQANSEHCRHKIFNASWTIDGEDKAMSLFQMIRHTHATHPGGVLSAYSDNAAVISGYAAGRFFADGNTGIYGAQQELVHIAIKVETHNHPTAISPHPGAATGCGGEIRDEGATGRGGKPKAGLCGFSVSDLQLAQNPLPWEDGRAHPERLASPEQIMVEGPLGAAAFNNEFGRPNLCGYFRTFHQCVASLQGEERRGYHKPIMLAGGYGSVRPSDVEKKILPVNTALVALGGPAMLIGLGGGSASSMASGSQSEDLDFASVQRANPEMERRCQEVIDRCWAMGEDNPIESIHDVGAGGLSNAFPELVHDSGRGGAFSLREIPNAEPGLSPMEIWCSEAQERYVMGIAEENLPMFIAMCKRENAPYAVVGRTTDEDRLVLGDSHFGNNPIDMPLSMLLGKPPMVHKTGEHIDVPRTRFETDDIDIVEAARRVLRLPTVASKSFLITIGDRSITGMVARDQMVGPWQVPVADVAVTTAAFDTTVGEAMSMGERTPIALLDAAASGRMAIGEAITNMAAAPIAKLSDISLSANWMVAAAHPGEGANLYDTVSAIAMSLCPDLGIAIPVGKDSMSMSAKWTADERDEQVTSPLSLVVTAFAPVTDVRRTLTPQLRTGSMDTELWLIDLGMAQNRLGASALSYVYSKLGKTCPNLDKSEYLVGFFGAIQALNAAGKLLAYHDRSDGGLWACVAEMAFAGRCGLDLDVSGLGPDAIAALFAEELGAVIQIRSSDAEAVAMAFKAHGLAEMTHVLGCPSGDNRVVVRNGDGVLIDEALLSLYADWTETSHHIQRIRDNPATADEERVHLLSPNNTGLFASLKFSPAASPKLRKSSRPRVAILREQGVNGQVEMGAAFDRSGFEAVDVHMSDLRAGRVSLSEFVGMVACGGFSYGDVLGAGGGWAKSILFSRQLRAEFKAFFHRPETFSLGVCNGCQMLSQLAPIIPGAAHWPRFVRNRSSQFEARLSQVEVLDSPSIFFSGMSGSMMPIPVAHGEGQTLFEDADQAQKAAGFAALRFVDSAGVAAGRYPQNPNGSAGGLTAFCSEDGRATIMMPHPERAFRTVQHSWHPENWGEDGPWMRLFCNARDWVGDVYI